MSKKYTFMQIARPPDGRISVFMGKDNLYYYKTHSGRTVKIKGQDYNSDVFNIHEKNIDAIINLTDNNIEILKSDPGDFIQVRFSKINLVIKNKDWWDNMPVIDLGLGVEKAEWLGAGMKKLKRR